MADPHPKTGWRTCDPVEISSRPVCGSRDQWNSPTPDLADHDLSPSGTLY